MLGGKAFDLLRDLNRIIDGFQQYQDDVVQQIIGEIKYIFEDNCQQAAEFTTLRDKAFWPVLSIRHEALQRSRRCLLTYLRDRLMSLKNLRWDFGPVIPLDVQNSLCVPELQFFNSYSKSLMCYMRRVSGNLGVDLTGDLNPPKSLFVEVRCVENFGKLELGDGEVVCLKKNSQHYLPRTQIESLIRQGILQHI